MELALAKIRFMFMLMKIYLVHVIVYFFSYIRQLHIIALK